MLFPQLKLKQRVLFPLGNRRRGHAVRTIQASHVAFNPVRNLDADPFESPFPALAQILAGIHFPEVVLAAAWNSHVL